MNDILFFGTYQHKVDSKGRVSIPAKWRKHFETLEFGEKIVFIHNKTLQGTNIINVHKIGETFGGEIITNQFQFIYQHNLDTEGRIVFKQEKEKLAILKGYGDYFTIEFI